MSSSSPAIFGSNNAIAIYHDENDLRWPPLWRVWVRIPSSHRIMRWRCPLRSRSFLQDPPPEAPSGKFSQGSQARYTTRRREKWANEKHPLKLP
ncbi:hypothetical protein TIFTF001_012041 [Ficus carica]|uniref:Uncharacterized protein n=1 Tax=Ficus carica TaxID=3494 RepID=A0AA88A107_FICCA|nr:hypothetical protein TIFTF001_012041 [Ficus carica]